MALWIILVNTWRFLTSVVIGVFGLAFIDLFRPVRNLGVQFESL